MMKHIFCSFYLIPLILIAGCAQQGAVEGIQASERHECQKYAPAEEAACLERAREGTVIYTPERHENRWERRRW